MSNEEVVLSGLPSFSGARPGPQPRSALKEGQTPPVNLQSPHPMAGTATEYEPFLPSGIPIPANHSTLR